MPWGISDSLLAAIVSVFVQDTHVRELILFGSRARHTNRPGSDFDFAIKGVNLNLDVLLNLNLALENLNTPYKFDVVIYERITDHNLISEIDTHGVVLMKKENL